MSDRIRLMWFLPQPLVGLAGQAPRATPVHIVDSLSSDEQYQALVSGDVDVIVTAMDNVIGWNHRAGPNDFRVIAQVERTTPLWLIAAPGRKTMTDLHGAKLLVDSVENGFVVALRTLLLQANIFSNDCQFTAAGGVTERYQALLTGRGDATLLGGHLAMRATEAGFVQIAHLQHSFPAFPGQGIVMCQSNPKRELIRRWLSELEQARQHTSDLSSLKPTAEGVAMLTEHRRLLGLPGGEDVYTDIADTSLIGEYLEQPK